MAAADLVRLAMADCSRQCSRLLWLWCLLVSGAGTDVERSSDCGAGRFLRILHDLCSIRIRWSVTLVRAKVWAIRYQPTGAERSWIARIVGGHDSS